MFEFAQWLQSTSLSVTVQSIRWIIPLLQSVHILMIGVVFVSILMIALRVLGQLRMDETFAEVWNRFAPWMWRGLVVMAVTGLVLVIGEPVREFTSTSFWLKMALILTGVVSTVAFGRSVQALRSGDKQVAEFSSGARAAAVVTVIVWLAIIFLGRAIAYDAEVWGALSLSASR